MPVELAVQSAPAWSSTSPDVLDLQQVVAGYGDPAVVLIAALFVVSEGLDATGVTAWAGQRVIAGAGESRTRLVVLLMLLCGGLTALITVNGAVAALLPVVVLIAVRLGTPASKLLLPLAFSAHAGSMLALTGTPVNVIVSDISDNAGLGGFGFFEFAIVGVPLLAGSIAIVVLLGDRLLPVRAPEHMPADFSEHARVLAEQYALDVDAERIARLRVGWGGARWGRGGALGEGWCRGAGGRGEPRRRMTPGTSWVGEGRPSGGCSRRRPGLALEGCSSRDDPLVSLEAARPRSSSARARRSPGRSCSPA